MLPCLDHICTPRLSRKAALGDIKRSFDALKFFFVKSKGASTWRCPVLIRLSCKLRWVVSNHTVML